MNIVSGSINFWYTVKNTSTKSTSSTIGTGTYKLVTAKETIGAAAVNTTTTTNTITNFHGIAALSSKDSAKNSFETFSITETSSSFAAEDTTSSTIRAGKNALGSEKGIGHGGGGSWQTGPIATTYRRFGFGYVMILASSIISFILCCLTLATCQCGTASSQCFPQFTFQIINKSETSQTVLTAINDILKTATFLASEYNESGYSGTDSATAGTSASASAFPFSTIYDDDPFGSSISDHFESSYNVSDKYNAPNPMLIKMLMQSRQSPRSDNVDTFAKNNFFEMGLMGYCRSKIAGNVTAVNLTSYNNKIPFTTLNKTCFGHISNGVDLMSTLVRDIGIELAKLTSNKDVKALSDAFVLAYEMSLPYLMSFSQKQENSMYFKSVKNALLVKNISKFLPLVVILCMTLWVLAGFECLLKLVGDARQGTVTSNKFNKLSPSTNLILEYLLFSKVHLKRFLVSSCLICHLGITFVIVCLGVYIGKMQKMLMEELEMANVRFASGFQLLIGATVCSFISFIVSVIGIWTE